MYTTYCANQPVAITTLEECKKYPGYEAFLQECLLHEDTRGLTLFSFLIKPIQRICKYPLLLRGKMIRHRRAFNCQINTQVNCGTDLLKSTPETHPDYENLCQALHKIEEVVDYINERKRLAENLQKILEVQNLIDVGEDLQVRDHWFTLVITYVIFHLTAGWRTNSSFCSRGVCKCISERQTC